MADAFIDGEPVSVDGALAEAAKLLASSRLPVIAGLGTDAAGARAAIALAQRLGGVIDHMHADALLRDLDAAREAGMMLTTPNEAAIRADTLLLVGPGLVSAWPQLVPRLLARAPDPELAGSRRIHWLCPGSRREVPAGELVPRIEVVGRDPRHVISALAGLRARVAGRACAKGAISAKALDALAARLTAARFGVAIWSPAELDALAIEMLCGLVKDLNATTRFSGLSLLPGDNAAGVMQVCGWMSGFPVRVGFGRGYPEHDPWRFDARRLVESGEGDCVLWISAYRPLAPDWNAAVPTIALTSSDTKFRHAPRILIAAGRPGVDHGCVERRADTGTLGWIEATRPSNAIQVAQAIGRIALALPGDRTGPC